MHKRKLESKEDYNQRARLEYQKRKQYFVSKAKEYRDNHRDKSHLYNKRTRERIKDQVFKAYGGPVCACCGENNRNFMTLDHIDNNGGIHRKELGGSSQKVYLWLIKNNFPPGFQILCYNCNMGKRVTGVCPHKLESQISSVKSSRVVKGDYEETDYSCSHGRAWELCEHGCTQHATK